MLHSAYEKSPTTKMFHFINQLLIKIGRHGFIEIVGSAHALVLPGKSRVQITRPFTFAHIIQIRGARTNQSAGSELI